MSPDEAELQAKRILVVDELENNLFLLQAILTEEGYEVELANNGKLALAKLEASPPDLVLLDIMMTKIDGYEITQRLHQNQKLPFIPILMIIASETASIPQGLNLGVNGFIYRPVGYDRLMLKIRVVLQLKELINLPQ